MTQVLEWVVVGAGPAGIAALGNLLDAGVNPAAIAWIDPEFNVGDFGTDWRYVHSNTPVDTFVKYYESSRAFGYVESGHPEFMIDKLAPLSSCLLLLAAEPLHWITKVLQNKVKALQDTVQHLELLHNYWLLTLASGKVLHAKKVVLAIGSTPKALNFSNPPSIPLRSALSPIQLKDAVQPDDTIAIFGSAQSAKSVAENVSKLKTKRTVLFYRSERSLERHFEGKEFSSIEMLPMTPKNLIAEMPNCTKTISAIGFERRHIPIAGLPENYGYDLTTGEIAPGIFGLGIAFPEIIPYEFGEKDYRLSAIWPFMKRLKKVLPYWLA